MRESVNKNEDFEAFVDEVFERLIQLKQRQILKAKHHVYISATAVCFCLQFVVMRFLIGMD